MVDNVTLFSIITVCFNAEKTINDTINSVLNQTYTNLEYLILDGNSKDKTVEIIKSYEQHFLDREITFKWISEPDKGIYDAMNKGISLAKGEVIGIINSDDWYEENTIEIVSSLYNNEPCIIAGAMNRVTFEKKVYKTMFNKNINSVVNFMPVNHPATFVSKKVYNQIGYFDTKYSLSADYDFIFRAFKANIPFIYTKSLFVNMRNSGATSQLDNIWISSKEDYFIQKKNTVRNAYFNYVKKQCFNCLVYIRDTIFKK